jgi:hypothetical protein
MKFGQTVQLSGRGGLHPDCRIIETFFALCALVRSSGFGERCVFVSPNRDGFYREGAPLRPHQDMAQTCSTLELRFALEFAQAISVLDSR